MSDTLQMAIGWVFLAVFVVSAGISLADAVGWLNIRTEWQRKALWSSTVASPIGAIALLGQTILDPDKPGPNDDTDGGGAIVAPTPTPSPTESQGEDGLQPGPEETTPPPPPSPIGSGDDSSNGVSDGSTDEIGRQDLNAINYTAWGEQNLAPRPFLANPPKKFYPSCVASTRSEARLSLPAEMARDCFRSLEQFNETTLLLHRDRRAAYVDSLKGAIGREGNAGRLEWLHEELYSFTDSGGQDFRAFADLSNSYRCDSAFMVNITRNRIVKDLDSCQANG